MAHAGHTPNFTILHTIPYFPQWDLLFVSLVCEQASFRFICFLPGLFPFLP